MKSKPSCPQHIAYWLDIAEEVWSTTLSERPQIPVRQKLWWYCNFTTNTNATMTQQWINIENPFQLPVLFVPSFYFHGFINNNNVFVGLLKQRCANHLSGEPIQSTHIRMYVLLYRNIYHSFSFVWVLTAWMREMWKLVMLIYKHIRTFEATISPTQNITWSWSSRTQQNLFRLI